MWKSGRSPDIDRTLTPRQGRALDDPVKFATRLPGPLSSLPVTSRDDPAEARGDLSEIWIVRGNPDHQLIHVIVVRTGRLDVVQLEERRRGQPPQPLVAIDEGVVVDDRLQQRCGLGDDVGVSVLAESARLWAGGR